MATKVARRTWNGRKPVTDILRRRVLPHLLRGPVLLRRQDRAAVVVHYIAAGSPGRKARFGIGQRYQALTDRYGALPWDQFEMIALLFGGRIVALAEVSRPRPGDATVWREASLSVLPRWRRLGLAERLARDCLDRVCRRDGQPMVMVVDPGNGPMRALALKLGGLPLRTEQGTLYRFDPPAPVSAQP
ncbi:MAG: GNAT family N-acetyltransferase [Roseivivax sp.]|nr:GNAT family N-acetyltransferase [Roseivivax sp.]